MSKKSTTTTTTELFHNDMRRVLLSRQPTSLEDNNSSSNRRKNNKKKKILERRTKPPIYEVDVDGAERVHTLLQHLQYQLKMANEESYQIVMGAYLNRGRARWWKKNKSIPNKTTSMTTTTLTDTNSVIICAADQNEELLNELSELLLSSSTSSPLSDNEVDPVHYQQASKISIETYNLVLESYALCATPRGERNYAQKARALLEEEILPMRSSSSFPFESVLHVIHAYAWQQANRQEPDCAQVAQDLLEQMIMQANLSQQNQNDDDEDTSSRIAEGILKEAYTYVIEAWSKSRGGALHCQAAFDAWQELVVESNDEDDNSSTVVDPVEVYSNVILAWTKEETETAMTKAQHLLEQMGDDPPLIASNAVLAGWCRLGNLDRARDVLHNDIPHPDITSYNSILYGMLKIKDKQSALQQCQEFMDSMPVAPNAFSYDVLMKCWLQSKADQISGQAAIQAEKLLAKVERCWQKGDRSLILSNRIYNMVLNAYAKSKLSDAASRAMDILSRMENEEKTDGWSPPAPDIISYTTVMECLSKSNDPQQAPRKVQELLERVAERYKLTKDPELMPNLRTYTMAIQTLARNHGPIEQARGLLTRLVREYEQTKDPSLRPNTYPYNYVLLCAANTFSNNDRKQAFQIAAQTFQELRHSEYENLKPDSYSYAFWLKCCNQLLVGKPAEEMRHKCVKFAMLECIQDDLANDEVLMRFKQGSPQWLVDEVLSSKQRQQQPPQVANGRKSSSSSSS